MFIIPRILFTHNMLSMCCEPLVLTQNNLEKIRYIFVKHKAGYAFSKRELDLGVVCTLL